MANFILKVIIGTLILVGCYYLTVLGFGITAPLWIFLAGNLTHVLEDGVTKLLGLDEE